MTVFSTEEHTMKLEENLIENTSNDYFKVRGNAT